MRKITLLLTFLTVSIFTLSAQQDAQYTQFMFNKLSLNPGYAISTDYACISCLHRSQWVGLEGAPTSQSLNARLPFYAKRIGLGVSINHDVIGPTNSWLFSLIYAYRVPIGDGNLGIGFQGSLRNYSINWAQTSAIQSGDGLIPMGQTKKTLPNFGGGIYYQTKKYYVGLSVPHVLDGDLTFYNGTLGNNTDFSQEKMHAFLMAGTVFKLNSKVKIKPAILMKYVKNTPFDMDIHASAIFHDKLWAGLTYRLGGLSDSVGESLDLVVQLQASQSIRIGLAYDFTLSRVRDVNSGTYEIVLDYCFKQRDKLTNPRFF